MIMHANKTKKAQKLKVDYAVAKSNFLLGL
jgi:hypothetical protein